jgi:UDP-N-acetylglucosamine 2-epimerase (non-hydrolysing)/GDP/UDP-N,N'-diacetylbacillosamine 2-epimerase (hydrolysing)
MGEEAWRVHRAGAPSLDHLRRQKLFTGEELEARLQLDLSQPTILVAYHPVTIARDTVREADAVFAALRKTEGQIVFCYPNADAGSRNLMERAKVFCAERGSGRIYTNLDPLTYWSLLAQVDLLLGNSSSGIMEAASFALPVVNIGIRQQGRERARNVIDTDADEQAIVQAIGQATDPEFRETLQGMENPYGNGHAAETIVRVLTGVPLSERLLMKFPPALEQQKASEF